MTIERTIIIGDIHGCFDEFIELTNKLDLDTTRDHLVLLGDYIDKGPAALDTIKYIIHDLPHKVFNLSCLLGNHEEKFLRWLSNKKVKETDGQTFKTLANSLNEDEIYILRSFLFLTAPIYNNTYLCIHAGIPDLPHSKVTINSYQYFNFEVLQTSSKNIKDLAKYLLFTRFVNPKGFPVSLGQEQPEDKYWTDVYSGKFGIVLFGHQPWPEVKYFPFAIGLDTGCVYGNKLTAMITYPNSGKKHEIVQVKAKKEYRKNHNGFGDSINTI